MSGAAGVADVGPARSSGAQALTPSLVAGALCAVRTVAFVELRRLVLLLQFFSRLPLPFRLDVTERDFAQGIVYLPLVGLVIGGLNAAACYAGYLLAGETVAVLAAIGMNLALTGAFHLDGLADTCDAIYSARSRERMLEIMKDSRIGTNGTCAIGLDFLWRYAALTALPLELALAALVTASVLARGLNPILMRSRYARAEGLGNLFVGKVSGARVTISIALASLITAAILGAVTAIIVPILILFNVLYRRYIEQIIGGMTGDTVGAGDELTELVALLVIAILNFHGIM